MADYELSVVAGNVGKDPELRNTPNGNQVLSFSVAQPKKFGKDAPKPDWFNVAVWDHGLQKMVASKVRKGAAVVIFGKRKPDRPANDGSGTVYRDIDCYRIGLVDLIFPLDKAPVPGQPATRQAPDADDDLPF